MAKLKSPKLWIAIVVVFVCLFSLLLLWVAKIPNTKGNGSNSSSSTTSQQGTNSSMTGLQDPLIAQKYDLVGIKNDDTVAVVSSSDDTEIVINLEHKQWKDPKWSPDKKLISVLGKSTNVSSSTSATTSTKSTSSSSSVGASVYDLYIYNLNDNRWTQATAYNQLELGISGYTWQDTDVIAFTQGVTPDNWLHNYSYSSNEIRKLFKVSGGLSFFAAEPSRYITIDESDVSLGEVDRVYGANGQVEFTFVGRAVEAGTKLNHLIPALDNNAFLLILDNNKIYTWSFSNPQFISPTLKETKVNNTSTSGLDMVCADKSGYFGWLVGAEIKKFLFVSLQANGNFTVLQTLTTTAPLQVEDATASCANGYFLVKTSVVGNTNAADQKWYLMNKDSVKEISAARSYSQLKMRIN